jgi:hypothetical protein
MAHIEKEDIREGNGNRNLRVKHQKEIAIRELDLMHKAIEDGEYKKAMHHKIIANVAIDEMVSASEMVEE